MLQTFVRAGAACPGRSRKGVMMGVADLMIVIPMLVVSVFFLGDISQIGTCREKLSFILTQASNYAVNLAPELDPAEPTRLVVNDLCAKNGLRISKLNLTVVKTTVGGCDAITVRADGDIPLLVGSVLPQITHMQDQSTAIVPANRVYAAVAINPYPFSTDNPSAGVSVYLPVIRPRTGVPIWQFPYDASLNSLHVVQGVTPAVSENTDPYFSQRPSLY